MTYTTVNIKTYTGLNLSLRLNEVTDGWVPQILNGTFGSNREYSFTGNVVTSMSEKQIDINMRLTPVVPVPAKPARYFLNYLSSAKISDVELIDSTFIYPIIRYTRNETTTYTKPIVDTVGYGKLGQTCVIRELKYNYSESPATIEFTISTKIPILYGPTFTIYMGLGNQNWDQAVADIRRVVREITPKIGDVDLRNVMLSLPAIGTSKYNIFDGNLDTIKAVLTGNSTSNPGTFSMYSFLDGTRRFSITGGYDVNAAACYSLEAHPSFPLTDLDSWVGYLKSAPKINLGDIGNGYAKLEMVTTRKGL
nr:MAG TPA: hypothetical protein [Caudoviricetes sp.]